MRAMNREPVLFDIVCYPNHTHTIRGMKSLTLPVKSLLLGIVTAVSAITTMAAPAPDNPLVLWYDKPAVKWVEALPVGNASWARWFLAA